MNWRDETRSLRWVVVIQYQLGERRAIGPHDDFPAAKSWVEDNRSELWSDYDIIPLEELTSSRIFSSGEDTEEFLNIQW